MTKEQYEIWFNTELDKQIKAPIAKESYENLAKRYKKKYNI